MIGMFTSSNGQDTVVYCVVSLLIAFYVVQGRVIAQETGENRTEERKEEFDVSQLPSWEEIKGRRAHMHEPDMSCCAPCVATEAEQHPDVFRRPCFVHALRKARKAFGATAGLSGGLKGASIKLPADRIPSQDIRAFQVVLETALEPAYLPAGWDDVDLYGLTPCPRITISEMIGGVKTFVRQEQDCGVEIEELKDGDGIQMAWSVAGVEVLPRGRHSEKPPRRGIVRLRLYGDQRLELRPRPSDFMPGGDRWHEGWDCFDKRELHALLTRIFRVPFEGPDEVVLDGYDTKYEGVRVFHGKIRSRSWNSVRRAPDAGQFPPHWWDEMRLLVTDSDPQYFCLQIALREDREMTEPEP